MFNTKIIACSVSITATAETLKPVYIREKNQLPQTHIVSRTALNIQSGLSLDAALNKYGYTLVLNLLNHSLGILYTPDDDELWDMATRNFRLFKKIENVTGKFTPYNLLQLIQTRDMAPVGYHLPVRQTWKEVLKDKKFTFGFYGIVANSIVQKTTAANLYAWMMSTYHYLDPSGVSSFTSIPNLSHFNLTSGEVTLFALLCVVFGAGLRAGNHLMKMMSSGAHLSDSLVFTLGLSKSRTPLETWVERRYDLTALSITNDIEASRRPLSAATRQIVKKHRIQQVKKFYDSSWCRPKA